MTHPEVPEASTALPAIHVHVDTSPKLKRTPRQRFLAAVTAVLIFVAGASVQPLIAWGIEKADTTLNPPPACPSEGSVSSDDHSVRSDIVVMNRLSTTRGCFTSTALDLADGQDFSGFVSWTNRTSKQQDDVSVKLDLPPGVSLVPGTAKFFFSRLKKGQLLKGDIVDQGANFGSYAPGGNFYVQYALHFDAPSAIKCGTSRFAIFGKRIDSTAPGSQLTEAAQLEYTKPC